MSKNLLPMILEDLLVGLCILLAFIYWLSA